MADKKISELNQVVEVGLNDMLLVVQDGTSKRASAQQLSNLLNVDLTLGELSDVSVSDIQDGQTILWDELSNKYRPTDIPDAVSINNILNGIIAANVSTSNIVSLLSGAVSSIQGEVSLQNVQIAAVSARVTSVDSYYTAITNATNAAVASVESHVNTVSAYSVLTDARVTSVNSFYQVVKTNTDASIVSVENHVNTVSAANVLTDARVTSVMAAVSNLASVELAARTSIMSNVNVVSAALETTQGTVSGLVTQVNAVSANVTSVNTRVTNTSAALETHINLVSAAAIRNLVSLVDTSIATGAGVNQYPLVWDNPSNKFSLRAPAVVSDGDKGDITITGGVWTIDNGVITNAKMANNSVTSSIISNNAVTVSAVLNNTLTNTKLAQVSTATFKGRTTAGTGNVEDLTTTQATAMLNVFSSTLKGLVPLSGGGTTNFLRADGTWTTPPGGSSPPYTLGTAVATTSGSSVSFLSIPSTVNRIRVLFNEVSTIAASNPIGIQLGTSGGFVTSGYVSGATDTNSSYEVDDMFITGSTDSNAADTTSGIMFIDRITSNTWLYTSVCKRNSGIVGIILGSGFIALGGVLDRLRLTSRLGSTLDLGSVNISYE